MAPVSTPAQIPQPSAAHEVKVFQYEGSFQSSKVGSSAASLGALLGPQGLCTLNTNINQSIAAIDKLPGLDRFRKNDFPLKPSLMSNKIFEALGISPEEAKRCTLRINAAFGGVTNTYDVMILVNRNQNPWEAKSGCIEFVVRKNTKGELSFDSIDILDKDKMAAKDINASLPTNIHNGKLLGLIQAEFSAKKQFDKKEIAEQSKAAVASSLGIKDPNSISIKWTEEKINPENPELPATKKSVVACLVMRAYDQEGKPIVRIGYKINSPPINDLNSLIRHKRTVTSDYILFDVSAITPRGYVEREPGSKNIRMGGIEITSGYGD